MSDLRTPLSRARGLGSAKDGLHHWWVQRLTAVALIPPGSTVFLATGGNGANNHFALLPALLL